MSRFDHFRRIDLPYRHIKGIPLEATILVPKSLVAKQDATHPVMVRWHGGGFVVGHRMYEPWFAQWLLDTAIKHGAIIIAPDYRLLPESNGHEVLDDVAHFWRWMRDGLSQYLRQNHLPAMDLQNVLCCGESSGGFISVYCALHLQEMLDYSLQEVKIAAVISISAPLDATAPEYTIPRPRKFMGRSPPPPRQALAKIRAYIKSIPPGRIRTECEPTYDMWELMLCIAQQAYLPRLFGAGGALEGLLETIERREMVPLWVVHGTEDTMVSTTFVVTDDQD